MHRKYESILDEIMLLLCEYQNINKRKMSERI